MKIYQLIEELEWCNNKDAEITVLLRKRHLDSTDKYFLYDIEEYDFNMLRSKDEIKLEITIDV